MHLLSYKCSTKWLHLVDRKREGVKGEGGREREGGREKERERGGERERERKRKREKERERERERLYIYRHTYTIRIITAYTQGTMKEPLDLVSKETDNRLLEYEHLD